jgi:hypothetical protein
VFGPERLSSGRTFETSGRKISDRIPVALSGGSLTMAQRQDRLTWWQ